MPFKLFSTLRPASSATTEHRLAKQNDKEFYKFFRNILGFRPRHVDIYKTALIHRSMSHATSGGHRVNNERLEYLGDAVLSTVVAQYLYKRYPYQGEGFLTEMRSKMVSRATLNKLGKKIGLPQLVEYDKSSQGVFKSRDGDAFEALIGAIYLEKGYDFTQKVIINRLYARYVDVDELANTDWNFKSKLLDWGQKKKKKVAFEVVRSFFPDDDHSRKQYEICIKINGKPYESAIDFSVKAAEQLAAEKTYKIVTQAENEKTSSGCFDSDP